MLLLGFFAVGLLLVELLLLASKSLNALLLLEFLLLHKLLETDLILVGLDDVLFHLLHFLLALELTDFFSLNVFFDLALDELTFEHLFLELLDVVELELFELVRDGFCVTLALLVFFLKLFTHFLVIFVEFLLLKVSPVLIDFLVDGVFACLKSFLCFTFVKHISVEELALQGLDHVLLIVQVSVCTLDLLTTQFVLIFLLLGVNFTATDLKVRKETT